MAQQAGTNKEERRTGPWLKVPPQSEGVNHVWTNAPLDRVSLRSAVGMGDILALFQPAQGRSARQTKHGRSRGYVKASASRRRSTMSIRA